MTQAKLLGPNDVGLPYIKFQIDDGDEDQTGSNGWLFGGRWFVSARSDDMNALGGVVAVSYEPRAKLRQDQITEFWESRQRMGNWRVCAATISALERLGLRPEDWPNAKPGYWNSASHAVRLALPSPHITASKQSDSAVACPVCDLSINAVHAAGDGMRNLQHSHEVCVAIDCPRCRTMFGAKLKVRIDVDRIIRGA